MKTLVHVMGVTGTGKTTLMDHAKDKGYSTVEVGRELRKRYPPEYFKNQGGPEHTEKEAWEIYLEQIDRAKSDIIFIDGQPRNVTQAHKCCDQSEYKHLFYILIQSDEILNERAESRGELEIKRLVNDKIALYDVLTILVRRQKEGKRIVTSIVNDDINYSFFDMKRICDTLL